MPAGLFGKRILVTRSKEQSKAFADKLMEAGAIPLVAPLLIFQARNSEKNTALLQQLDTFSWLFFTSANGVKFFFEHVERVQMEAMLSHLHIAVVGKKTEQMLKHYGYEAAFIPNSFQGSQMVSEFLQTYGSEQTILLVCGNKSRNEIPDQLKQARVFFRKLIMYDTLINEITTVQLTDYIKTGMIDVYTFTSPSTIAAFEEMTASIPAYIDVIKQQKLCLCIGTTTKDKATQAGFKQLRVPDEFTIDGMIETLHDHFKTKG
ncbi:uroporphyrinogen-III synthase [Radiobacillus sp. PE A8.2]|uniref:uroporphyrinogen-III synthase n=1 Tax=Radiobacillus sp. PE A8.2 TaxID=3380349 RepID=UPI00388D59DD